MFDRLDKVTLRPVMKGNSYVYNTIRYVRIELAIITRDLWVYC